MLPDWRERIHIVPGFSDPLHRQLIFKLCLGRIPWIPVCEAPSRLNRLSYHLKRPARIAFGRLIAHFALGALGIGRPSQIEFLSSGVPHEKVGFLAYTPDINLASIPNRSRPDDVLRFVFVGRLIRLKGLDLLIRALRRSIDQVPDVACHLHIYGSGSEEQELRGLVVRQCLEMNVSFHGVVSHSEIAEAYRLPGVFVLPSRGDGWGAVLNEAAAAGLPLIGSTACGASYHLIHQAVNGFRFESNNIGSLQRCLQAYMKDRSLVQTHGVRSKEIAKEFTPATQAKNLCVQLESWIAMG